MTYKAIDHVIDKINSNTAAWRDPQEQRIADGLCALLVEVAKRSARHFPNNTKGDFVRELRMLESDILQYLIPFMVITLSRCSDIQHLTKILDDRLRLYHDMAREDAEKAERAA